MATGSVTSPTKTATFTITGASSDNVVQLCKVGRTVTAYIPALSSVELAAWGTKELGTYPTEFRPPISIRFPIVRQGATTVNAIYYCITYDGRFQLNNQGGAATSGAVMATCISWLTES